MICDKINEMNQSIGIRPEEAVIKHISEGVEDAETNEVKSDITEEPLHVTAPVDEETTPEVTPLSVKKESLDGDSE